MERQEREQRQRGSSAAGAGPGEAGPPPGWRWWAAGLPPLAVGLWVVACGPKRPPPDFAPDPGLVARITDLRMTVRPDVVCPGRAVGTAYEALLDDGTALPFSTRYDDKNPPPLHVVFLARTSPEATPRADGGWETASDPLASAMHGFRLRALVRAKPEVSTETVVPPEYRCLPHAFRFQGPRGSAGQSGAPGPDVIVRLDVLSSPFSDRLLVAAIEVGHAPPFYVLAEADLIPPADWLLMETQGGPGGRGLAGADGRQGVAGRDGCPAGAGGAGAAGSNGGPGGPGGPGGRVTVIVPRELPYLAGLVDGYSLAGPGGVGGPGGTGGAGGPGGKGMTENGQTCEDGRAGEKGSDGQGGPEGPAGSPGPRPQVITVAGDDVFGARVPAPLADLIEYTRNRN